MALEWKTTLNPVDYEHAVITMTQRAQEIHDGKACELVWLLEHPSLYTAGTSTNMTDLLDPKGLPVYKTGRGGQLTYHGPGQRVVYLMLDLKKRGADIRQYVFNLEEWLIHALKQCSVKAERKTGRVGLWVEHKKGEDDKIAAVGVRVQKWISLHGVAINICPNLELFKGIVPCGIKDHGVTSLRELGINIEMSSFDELLKEAFHHVFGENRDYSPTPLSI